LVERKSPNVRLLDGLKKLVDPRGPLGDVVSPDITFKERQGVPTTSPHTTRAILHAPKEHVERSIAAPRFVALADANDVPSDRVRQVSAYVEEHWSPVYDSTQSADLLEIILASQRQVGWAVTQRESEQSRLARRAHQNAEDFVEVMQTCQIQASDEWANGYYETIAGNDPCVIDGEILRGEATYEWNEDGSRGKMIHDGIVRGGTMITGGRREYRAKTKGYVHWTKDDLPERARQQAAFDARPVQNVRRALEDCQNALPMYRCVGINFRKDRRAV
jgi:hypothetical protein